MIRCTTAVVLRTRHVVVCIPCLSSFYRHGLDFHRRDTASRTFSVAACFEGGVVGAFGEQRPKPLVCVLGDEGYPRPPPLPPKATCS